MIKPQIYKLKIYGPHNNYRPFGSSAHIIFFSYQITEHRDGSN
jgi:hypothetical protein